MTLQYVSQNHQTLKRYSTWRYSHISRDMIKRPLKGKSPPHKPLPYKVQYNPSPKIFADQKLLSQSQNQGAKRKQYKLFLIFMSHLVLLKSSLGLPFFWPTIYTILVGGFNPFEKYKSNYGSFPQIGMKIEKNWNHHLDILLSFLESFPS